MPIVWSVNAIASTIYYTGLDYESVGNFSSIISLNLVVSSIAIKLYKIYFLME